MISERRIKRGVQKFGKVTVNKVVLAILRFNLPVPSFNAKSLIALSTVGRRSGKARVTPMGYVKVDDRAILVVSEHGSRSDWYRNARAAGSVEVLLEGKNRRATVRPVPEEDPAAVLRRMTSKSVAAANRALWSDPRVIEIRLLD